MKMQENFLYEIKKSKFYGFVFDVCNTEEIENIIKEIKILHKKATHIVWAYILKSPVLEKCFDDGEPSGTAGKPILNVLQKKGLGNKFVCVVRYFGGVKLGAGGLLRAYSKTASESLK